MPPPTLSSVPSSSMQRPNSQSSPGSNSPSASLSTNLEISLWPSKNEESLSDLRSIADPPEMSSPRSRYTSLVRDHLPRSGSQDHRLSIARPSCQDFRNSSERVQPGFQQCRAVLEAAGAGPSQRSGLLSHSPTSHGIVPSLRG